MQAFGRIIGVVVIAGAAVAALLSLYYGIQLISAVVDGAKQLKPEIYVPLVVTLATAAMGLAVTLYTQTRIQSNEIASAHRDKKVEIYLEFLTFVERAIASVKPELGETDFDADEFAKQLFEFRKKAILWASPGVLKALSELSKPDHDNPMHLFDVLDYMQREIRRDIGLTNRGLEKDFFSKLPLSDPEELDRMRNSEKA